MTAPADREDDAALTRIEVRVEGSARGYVAGRDQYITQQAPAPVTAVRTLPRDVAAFTGRQAEVDRILAAAQPSRAVAIHTIDGMPGIGKTALAVHAARQLTDRYPDGQMFLRLNAHTPGQNPAEPADALAALLLSLGIDPRSIPDGLEARAGLWRDRLTGRRMLLVLDDAVDHAQVEPLLPGAEGCLVLVTSRHRLAALDGAAPLPLDILSSADAALLFTRLAHRTPTTAADTDAVAQIVELSGYLPLAIALLAGRFAHHPRWNLAEYAEEFAATQDRLDELAAGDRAVTAAFDMSYRALPVQRQGLFRRLGLHPGPDTDAYATAALAGIPLTQARRELEALYTDHLIDSPVSGRYRLHDLLRTYAQKLTSENDPADDRDATTGRLLDYYQYTAESADHHLNTLSRPTTAPPGTAPAALPDLVTHQQALAWMRTERANLTAWIHRAAATAQHSYAIRLTAALAAHLRQQGPWHEAISLHKAAVTTARQTGDRLGEANALRELGRLRYATGNFPAAADLQQQALDLYRAIGNPHGEANALRRLGQVRYATGDFPAAADLAQQALELYRPFGFRTGEANALHDLGRVRTATGDYPGATDLLQQSRSLFRKLGDIQGEAEVLNSTGVLLAETSGPQEALATYRQALHLARQVQSPLDEAHALEGTARCQVRTGQWQAALSDLREAVTIYRRIGAAEAPTASAYLAQLQAEYREEAPVQESTD
jgi:tetratricopeptide (TPR) repeat protein